MANAFNYTLAQKKNYAKIANKQVVVVSAQTVYINPKNPKTWALKPIKNMRTEVLLDQTGGDGDNLSTLIANQTGYKGRVGIYEGMKITPEVNSAIDLNPSEEDLEKASANQGILTLRQDGIIKVLNGITSLAELERVITIED
jgi:hypothetical protein